MTEPIHISGMGVVSALGNDVETLSAKLNEGAQPFAEIEVPRELPSRSRLAAKVGDFSAGDYIPPNQARRMDKVTKMTLVAAMKALADAGVSEDVRDSERVGVVMGTGFGSTEYTDDFYVGLVTRGPAKANPFLFPNTVPNAAAGMLAIQLGVRGLNTTFCARETSAEQALSYAFRQLQLGRAELVCVGGADEISPFLYHAFSVTRALAPRDPRGDEIMAPYDRRRNGLILGEGATVLLLERESHLSARGGSSYGLIRAIETASAPVGTMGYHPQGEEIRLSVQKALHSAALKFDELDWISGAANSTELLDVAECRAFNSFVSKGKLTPPITALKNYTGCFHGCGTLRLALALLAMKQGFIPCTPGLQEPEYSDKIRFVQYQPLERDTKLLLHSSASYGGTSVSIIVEKTH